MTVDEKLDFLIANMATKEDIKDMATKSDLKEMVAKSDLRVKTNMVFGELDSTEERINKKFDSINEILKKIREDINATRYSNQTVELLLKRQDKLEEELQELKRKIS